ncbi:hypothetical protein NVV76_05905 [Pediococcus ethanolidurans]|uniref:hypothetical protein n=1 Tax=Pediococcus ethanolidurans TaxID=319653 RepID=UPI0021E7B429|nr:hypothetical protein [Pediococcus ethanolidurans]MCV3320788.1 hypothetical protein [Pediococcus ethanolidurans]MCV3327694.1 hypothetical protein [Pediococcus ethanolidurans]
MNKAEIKQLSTLSEEVGKNKALNRLANGMFPYQPIAIEAKNDLDKSIKARNDYAMQLAGEPDE